MPAAASTALRPAGSTPSSWMIGSVCQMVLPAFSSNALTDENIADIAAYLLSLNEAQTTAVVAAQAPTSPPPGGRPFPPAIRSMAVRSLRQIARCAMVRTHNKGALARHYTEKRPARKRQRDGFYRESDTSDAQAVSNRAQRERRRRRCRIRGVALNRPHVCS